MHAKSKTEAHVVAKKIDFAEVMFNHLVKHYTPTQTFTAIDVYPLTKKYGKKPAFATQLLRRLMTVDCVIRTEEMVENQRSHGSIPLYRLTGKDYAAPTNSLSAKYLCEVAEQNARYTGYQLELQAILNNITRERVCHA